MADLAVLQSHVSTTGPDTFDYCFDVIDWSVRLRSPKLTPQDIENIPPHHRRTNSHEICITYLSDRQKSTHPDTDKNTRLHAKQLGYSSKFPTAIRHSPIEMGGLALIDLRTG